jgi:hypothetical protein
MGVFFNPKHTPGFDGEAEALFFARDPEEIAQTLAALQNDDAAWQLNTTGCAGGGCPALPAVPFAFGVAANGASASAPVGQGSFWGGATPQGPGAQPSHMSSIKAVRAYQHGFCSTQRKFSNPTSGTGVFELIDKGFFDNFFKPGRVCSNPVANLDGRIDYTNLTSYLAHSEGTQSDVRGGFLFASSLEVFDLNVGVGHFEPCHVDFNVGYELGLADGRLAVTAQSVNSFNSGHGELCEGFPAIANNVRIAITDTLPGKIHQAADLVQMVPQDVNDTRFDGCDPNAADPCASFADGLTLENLIKAGAASQGLTAPEIQQVLFTLRNRVGGRLLNWRCESRDFSPPTGHPRNRCEYIVRAKRLNVMPDAFELVWFDDDRDFAAPAIPMYYLSFVQFKTSPLCTRKPDATDPSLINPSGSVIFNRAFANVHNFGQFGCQ